MKRMVDEHSLDTEIPWHERNDKSICKCRVQINYL